MKTSTISKVAILIISLLIALSASALAQSGSLQPYAPYNPQAKIVFLPTGSTQGQIPSIPLKPYAEYNPELEALFVQSGSPGIPSSTRLEPYAPYDMPSDMPHK